MNIDSIASVVTGQPAAGVREQASAAVLGHALDNERQQGQGMVQMLERSVQPHLGGSIDIRV